MQSSSRKLQIGIIGSAGIEEYPKGVRSKQEIYKVAEKIGELVAENGGILVTGGKGGVMEAACKGAKQKSGITVGVVKGKKRKTANRFVDVEVVSGMEGCGEETILVLMCDGVVAIGGGAGTLQELAIAYRNRRPIVALKNLPGWAEKLANSYLDERKKTKIIEAETPQQAIKILINKINMLSSKKKK